MTTKVDMTVKVVLTQLRNSVGRVSSTVSTSCENRFRMRPVGVVSKNAMGDRSMFLSMLKCMTREARTEQIATLME